MKKILLLFLFIFVTTLNYSQVDVKERLKGYVNPEEIVTLSENIPFNQAIEVLSKVSAKLTGKSIVSTTGDSSPIGIEINKMPYKRVLRILTQMKGLLIEEMPTTFVVKSPGTDNASLGEDVYASVESREVEISALFFDASVRDARERGINWDYLLGKAGLSFGSKLNTFLTETEQVEGQVQTQQNLDFNVSNSTEFDIGDFSGDATAAFKFFENENLGEIIARPVVSVRNKQKGRIQIGEDISIKERDFSGNIIDKFFSTGTIIEVTPYIYNEDGIDYILLKLMVERSSGTPGQISTTIQKTSAQTEVLMLNGEETIIGGLFVNVENNERRGIPILKDLPWWVFGIRYLTGYESTTIEKREIIILVKTSILPTLKERVAQKKENLIKKALQENEEMTEQYKIKNMKKELEEEN